MSALLYLLRCKTVNGLKRLLKNPLRALPAAILVIYLVGSVIFSKVNPSAVAPMTLNHRVNSILLIFNSLALILTFWQRAVSINFFSKADTHYLFCGPFRPASLLLYGLSLELKGLLISASFLLWQYGNLRSLGLSVPVYIYLMLLYVLGNYLAVLCGSLLYGLVSDPDRRKSILKILLPLLVIIYLVGPALYVLWPHLQNSFQGWTWSAFFDQLGALPFLRYLPIAGWIIAVYDGLVGTFGLTAWLALSALVLGIPLLIAILYRLPLDYYEECLSNNRMEEGSDKDARLEAFEEMQRQSLSKIVIRHEGFRFGSGWTTLVAYQLQQQLRQNRFFFGLWDFAAPLVIAVLFFKNRANSDYSLRLLIIYTLLSLLASLLSNRLSALKANNYTLPFSAWGFYGGFTLLTLASTWFKQLLTLILIVCCGSPLLLKVAAQALLLVWGARLVSINMGYLSAGLFGLGKGILRTAGRFVLRALVLCLFAVPLILAIFWQQPLLILPAVPVLALSMLAARGGWGLILRRGPELGED